MYELVVCSHHPRASGMAIRTLLLLLPPASYFHRGAEFSPFARKRPRLFSGGCGDAQDLNHPWRYRIDRCLRPDELVGEEAWDGGAGGFGSFPLPLPRALHLLDPAAFPSTSQARRACRLGRVVILRGDGGRDGGGGGERADEELVSARLFDNLGAFSEVAPGDALAVGSAASGVEGLDRIFLRARSPDPFYPPGSSGHVHPPPSVVERMAAAAAADEGGRRPGRAAAQVHDAVLYEDSHVAVVSKPEGIDTLGEKRRDLRSVLPFLLRPGRGSGPARREEAAYLPRPVHRLDRRTSGCVLVAKSAGAASVLGTMFESRRVRKSYVAVVFGDPPEGGGATAVGGRPYCTIDHPIDGRDSVTLWRKVATARSEEWGTLSLLHVLPRTGRTHQIRRHLSYCLGCAIVGDSKYDGGGERNRAARSLGMFLCSNAIEFPHEQLDGTDHQFRRDGSRTAMVDGRVRVELPLPSKFLEIMGKDAKHAAGSSLDILL